MLADVLYLCITFLVPRCEAMRGAAELTQPRLKFHDQFWQEVRVIVFNVEAGQVHGSVPVGYRHDFDHLHSTVVQFMLACGNIICNYTKYTWVPWLPSCLLLLLLVTPVAGPRSGIRGRMDSVMLDTRHGSSSCSIRVLQPSYYNIQYIISQSKDFYKKDKLAYALEAACGAGRGGRGGSCAGSPPPPPHWTGRTEGPC